MEKYKVSIVVPVYNCEKYLSRCIESVLSQNYKNVELMLINDGSKDESFEIMQQYQKQYSDIIKIYTQDNHGVGYTRNVGIEEATGDYITFLDADDWFDTNFISTMVNNIKDNDILVSGYKRVNDKNETFFKLQLNPSNRWSQFRIVIIWAKLYKLSHIKRNHIRFEDIHYAEDIVFSLTNYSYTSKVISIDYMGYNYYDNQQSLTYNDLVKKNNDMNYVFQCITKHVDHSDILKTQFKEYSEYFYLKLYASYLVDKSRILSLKELQDYHRELFSYIKDVFEKYDWKMHCHYEKDEPFSFNLITILVVVTNKLKIDRLLVWLLHKVFYKK